MYNGAPKGSSMNFNCLRSWSTIAVCMAVLACGDDGGSGAEAEQGRATILNSSAASIAASALADAPPQEFVVARTRVEGRVAASDRSHVRSLMLGAGRAASVVSDPQVTTTRRAAAVALGATLDANKEIDVVSTQASIDALLSEVQKIVPAATTCDALPSGKAEACAIAFLILEVQRSEGVAAVSDASVPAVDTGVVATDAGTDAGTDAAVVDAGLPSATAIVCPGRDLTGAREIPAGTISENQTWSGKISITGGVYVSTAQITIDPGTQIFMGSDALLYFGYTDAVGLFANGTAANPITICGKVAEKGYWGTITVSDKVTSDSHLSNVLIAEGGHSDSALALDGDILIENVQIADSGKDGATAKDFKVGGSSLSVRGAVGYPLVLEAAAALARVPVGGSFTGNGTDQVVLRFGTVDIDLTVHDLGVPYVQEQGLYQNSGNLVLDPGIEWRLKSDTVIDFGYIAGSSVMMNGTAAAPIKFMPVDANSKWGSVTFESKVNSNSVLSYVEFTGGGQSRDAVLRVDAPIKFDHVTLSKNLTGLDVSKAGLAPGSTALTISETSARPITVEMEGAYTLPADSTLTGNTIDQVAFTGNTFATSGTLLNLGVPYYASSSLYSGNGVALTIAPGTAFVLAADVSLTLGYYASNTVTVVGTAAQPITFRGEQALPGYWSGINFGYGTTASRFDFIEVHDAGGGSTGAAFKTEIAVPITNSKFANSAGYGIDKARAIAIDYAMGGNTFTGCALGDVNVH